MHTSNDSDMIELQCWRYNGSPANTFAVTLSKSQRLWDLQTQIKEEDPESFKDCSAVNISLYSISDVEDSNLITTLSNWSPKQCVPLLTRSKVGEHAGNIIIACRPDQSMYYWKCLSRLPFDIDLFFAVFKAGKHFYKFFGFLGHLTGKGEKGKNALLKPRMKT